MPVDERPDLRTTDRDVRAEASVLGYEALKAIVADRFARLHRNLDAGARPAPANRTVR